MSTITTINATDLITNSRANINDNFSNLNTDKIETSVLDTDTSLAADSDAKIATQKATKAYVDSKTLTNAEIETTAGATHSLTTTANQKVIVWAKGSDRRASGTYGTYVLSYDGVAKDTVVGGAQTSATDNNVPFSLMYTETPGAGTKDITVTGGASLSNVVIIVFKY